MTQNIVCVEVQRQRALVFVKLNPNKLDSLPKNGRDVSRIGHYGTGDLELSIASNDDLAIAKEFIEQAYAKVGGG